MKLPAAALEGGIMPFYAHNLPIYCLIKFMLYIYNKFSYMKIPLVLKVSSKKDLYKRLIAIVQCLLPDERKLTTSEIDVFSHVLAKSNFHSQFNDKNRKINVKELALTDSAFAMHRARIAKKGWIVDKLPDKFIYKVYKELDNEIEFSIKIKMDD